jgi:hypothetical protein
MRSRPIGDYIHLGTIVEYLHRCKPGTPIHGDTFVLSGIDRLLVQLESFGLTVSRRAANPELVPLRKDLAATPVGSVLTNEQAAQLADVLTSFQKTLYAEAVGSLAYIASVKRYDVDRLLTDVPSLFAPHVFDVLPDIARLDFAEGGKCIAYELPTAAAFHLMRGTEDVLRSFYCQLVKQKGSRVKPLNWGPMVDSLKKRRKPPPAVLTSDLDTIRIQFRNPTQHPDKVYDIEEVQDLLGRCIDVVNRMMKPLG